MHLTRSFRVSLIWIFPLLDNEAPVHPPGIPEPLDIDPALKPESTAWGTEKSITQGDRIQQKSNVDFGRRFKQIRFRWLSPAGI